MKNILTGCIQPIFILAFCLMFFYQNSAIAQIQTDKDIKGVLPGQAVDTRSLSMAGTTIADILSGPSIGINPALPGLFHKSTFIQFNTNHNWGNNFLQHTLTLPTLSNGAHHITARLGLLHQGAENLPFSSISTLPEPDVTMYRAELGYAISLSDYFSIGTLQSVSYTTTNEEAQFWNYIADLGLIYAPDGPISYGLVFRGLGHETNYHIIETGQTTLGSQLARQSLEVGATLQYPSEDKTYLSISFANEKRFGEEGLWYKAGIEIIPFSEFSLRGGTMINFEQSLFIPRMGLGINAGVVQIDYMIAPKNILVEQFHQIGLTIQF